MLKVSFKMLNTFLKVAAKSSIQQVFHCLRDGSFFSDERKCCSPVIIIKNRAFKSILLAVLFIHCWICKTIFVLSHNFSPGRLLLHCQYFELPTYRELPSVLSKELLTTKKRTEILQVVIFYHFMCLKNYLLRKTALSHCDKPPMQLLWTL